MLVEIFAHNRQDMKRDAYSTNFQLDFTLVTRNIYIFLQFG